PFIDYGITELNHIKETISGILPYQEKIGAAVKDLIDVSVDLSTANYLYSREQDIRDLLDILSDDKVFASFQHMVSTEVDEESSWLSNLERTIMANYKGFGPEISVTADRLGKLQESLHRGIKARSNPFSWFSWRFLSEDKKMMPRVLVANNLKNNKQAINILVEKVDNRLNIEHNISLIAEKKWLVGFPENLRKIDIQNWFYYQKLTMKARALFISIRNLKDFISIGKLSYEALKSQLEALLYIVKEVPDQHREWQKYLTPMQIDRIANSKEYAEKMIDSVDRDFESICEFDQLKDGFAPFETHIIDKISEEEQDSEEETEENFSIEQRIQLLNNSIKLSWIDHIETKYPILRSISSSKFEKLEKELQEAISDKQSISNEILLLKARERTYQDLEYNRLNNLITYRDLLHQTTKKRRIWPLRKLMTNFREELFDLIPCWMASPESASAIFPMEEAFDLVIFDEASQCYAEKGLPAMMRGKQVVIAGDDKQLQPLDIYKVRWEDDNDHDIPELEIDSLLNLAKRHLSEVQLQGHYRAKSPELMDFSNRHFYNGNLTLLPDYHIINSEEPAIEYKNVEGIWEDNINNDEAWEIVQLTDRLIDQQPDKTIGIVTFNARQQGHILDLLEQYAINHQRLWPEHLFVKNIENVQGDERDIIIFSTGYAPDKNGRMNVKFGSLNVAGGENRLNVAVSRAREKIYLITSIFPMQLHVEETRNEGPKLFRDYLNYAFEVSHGRFTPATPPYAKRENNWYLKNHLKEITIPSVDFTLTEELPFADLSVCHQGKYKSLVLTDDHTYFESLSSKDPHAYKPFLFAKKNWRYRRFFSREIWRNRQELESRVAGFISGSIEE
ncbi:MAG: AAA domain-containing protein, partial [Cyclobacteriaceae bacterium]